METEEFSWDSSACSAAGGRRGAAGCHLLQRPVQLWETKDTVYDHKTGNQMFSTETSAPVLT